MYDATFESNEFVAETRDEAITKASRFYSVDKAELEIREPQAGSIFGLGSRAVVVAVPKSASGRRPDPGSDRGDRGRDRSDRGDRNDRGDRGRGRSRGRDKSGARDSGVCTGALGSSLADGLKSSISGSTTGKSASLTAIV